MGLNKLFSTGKLERMREVTTFSEFDGGETTQDKNEASVEKIGLDQNKKPTPTDAKNKGSAAQIAPQKSTPEMPSSDSLPAFDPQNPNKHKLTPDCATVETSGIATMSELIQYFVHADTLDEERKFSLILNDNQIDSPLTADIVDLAIGIGAQYLSLSGCLKPEKFSKLSRFCEIKSNQLKEYE